MQALESKNLTALRMHLKSVEALLDRDIRAFDPNAVIPLEAGPAQQAESDEAAADNSSAAPANSSTLLAFLAVSGWLPGLEELVEWDKSRGDAGDRLIIDQPGGDGLYAAPPLLLAIKAGHVPVAAYLLQRGASVAVADAQGETPLEVAAYSGSWELTSMLLESGTLLSGGLLALRVRLHEESESLPRLAGRWSELREGMNVRLEHLQSLVPRAFQPLSFELEAVGDLPEAWILLYKNKVMCAFARGVVSRGKTTSSTERLLVAHNYDSFARDYSLSCVILACILGAFGLMTYVAFRIRVYGWFETPTSLAEYIPGAFDPMRLTDPDFDPSRQKGRLPYLTAKEYLGPQTSSCMEGPSTFVQALLGVFNSWLLLVIRIPPEKDPYDEDYLSDDDDECRARVRDRSVGLAHRVRLLELTARNLAFVALILWLVFQTGRGGEAALLVFVFLLHAWVAASVAVSTVPAPPTEPEITPGDSGSKREEKLDSARMVHALFSVQYGPRWTRTVCSTRSSATPKDQWLQRRRRQRAQQRKQQQHVSQSGFDTDRSGSEAGKERAGEEETAVVPNTLEADETAFSDWFQRTFLQSSLLHTNHGPVLITSVGSIILVAMLLLWISHLRRQDVSAWLYYYTGTTAADLFYAYGVPGSVHRGVAIELELLLLLVAGERVYGIMSMVHVGAYTLQQRKEAIRFARRYQPTICKKSPDEALSIKGAMVAVDECVRCFDFALELSSVRWAVLREPTLIAYACTVLLLSVTVVLLAAPWIFLESWTQSVDFVDPMVLLCLSVCLTTPLVGLLFTAAAANREIVQQREHMRQATDAAVTLAASLGKEADDVEYVQLRVKSAEALQHSFLRWPGGRNLGMAEPVLLLCLLAGAAALAITLGGV